MNMKELSIEEKARAYDKALERAQALYNDKNEIGYANAESVLEEVFPFLKESEDERIRKAIMEHFAGSHSSIYPYKGFTKKQILDWLEKQNSNVDNANKEYWRGYREGKQEILDKYAELEKQGREKPADNVEPKFKVGDWVTNGLCAWRIDSIDEDMYYTNHCGIDCGGDIESIDEEYHIWTIQDAKDGDVLWHSDTASHGTFIFKQIRYDGKVLCYCDYDSEDHFCTGEHHTCCWSSDKCIKPATKEQRDTLFAKMKEAGYEWNLDTKELKKIGAKQAMYDKHAWDEENDYNLKLILATINHDQDLSLETKNKLSYWLKSFKDRVQLEQKHDDWNHTLIKN